MWPPGPLPRGAAGMGARFGPGSVLIFGQAERRLVQVSVKARGMAAAAMSGGIPPKAHQANVVAVGIGHDRIPGGPEGVKRRHDRGPSVNCQRPIDASTAPFGPRGIPAQGGLSSSISSRSGIP